ncbi:MAG: GIY-YIG nuclease family protein [Cohaesibacter sp.]|nr:GIY-YIG nuclease family protein [Cohaesibacter sp.]
MTDLDELRSELDAFAKPEKKKARSPKEERIIAGFEEIQQFFEQHDRLPSNGEDRDIFERLYATRLKQIRNQTECLEILESLDHQNLLDASATEDEISLDEISDDELMAELNDAFDSGNSLRQLRHVKTRAEIKAAEDIADRTLCEDFETFKPVFDTVQKELKSGTRETIPYGKKETGIDHNPNIEQGDFFILAGQIVYVADVGEEIKAPNGDKDARLRAIYSNGTESDILRRSLQRALYKEDASRRITNPIAGPLFSGIAEEDDQASGTIYVLRSKSDLPQVAQNRNILHKIGVTGSNVGKRVANASHDTTFLLADVEIVATYELYNINRSKLENLIHKFFETARLNIEIKDRFGNPVAPREWFLVPLSAIDDAVSKITDGTISKYQYDASAAKLMRISST